MYKPNNRPKITPQEALSRTQNLCSRQEKCLSEIRKKLQTWKIEPQDQEHILNSLQEDRFIDESRYTQFFVRDKFLFNKWGRIKISYQLRMKEIPEDIISQALEQINDKDYIQTLDDLLCSKIKSLPQQDPYQLRGKLLRFAQGRGFEPHLILNSMDKLNY